MANNIELAKAFVPVLDEVYKNAALTADLDGAPELARAGANANELLIPMIDMQGLAKYDRNSGYTDGDVTLTTETVKTNYDRGRMFQVDAMDNAETAGIAFGRLAGEFIRVKVAPEIDAFRFATYASKSGIGSAEGELADGKQVLAAIRAAVTAMDEAEVPSTERVLYITPTLYGMVQDLDTYASKQVLAGFAAIHTVPQSRFYTKVTLKESGEGGYEKDSSNGTEINFLIVHKPAVIQFTKHIAPKIIDPAANQHADAYKFGYRVVSVTDVYKNKVAGIYCHHKTSEAV